MHARAWIAVIVVVALSLAALAWFVPRVPKAGTAPEPQEQNATTTTASDLEREYEELRRSAEMNAQLAADERNMQINMSLDELNALAEPLPVEDMAPPD